MTDAPKNAPGSHLVLHTKEKAAAILGVRVSWLERRAAERKVPFTLLGGRYMFTDLHLKEIVALYEQGPTGNTAKPKQDLRRRRRTSTRPQPTRGGVAPLVPRPRVRDDRH
ncbi:hypothetical protein CLV63_111213 [Murinocardiopsis flavida]|uniref:Excisionase family DNA binding protein n=1 Tax=Murinocardiopsis flavida TaxID=645275 RepID=A0A2P8DHC5_9ACTN|nr:hypothetical protein [Murinocardiopsis flavida]PSK96616.1 hypothetical protein CLV63_111213 [Murinocardiopsis flavida]